MIRWRGRDLDRREQVANAHDDFVDLTPVSEIPAERVKDAWAALRAGQGTPLIGEVRDAGQEEFLDE